MARISSVPLIEEVSRILGEGMAAEELVDERTLWLVICSALVPAPTTDSDANKTLEAWFGAQVPADSVKLAEIRRIVNDASLNLEATGRAFEQHMATTAASGRKDRGAFFTPTTLVQETLRHSVSPVLDGATSRAEVLNLKFCDPAAGAGAFAFPLIELVTSHLASHSSYDTLASARRAVIANCVYFVDVDPLTVALLRSLVWIYSDCSLDLVRSIERKIVVGDAINSSLDPVFELSSVFTGFNWRCAFPEVFELGGFSAIVGNPPWGGLRPMASRSQLRDDENWDEYSEQRLNYVQTLKSGTLYSLQGKGDADLYRYFLERSLQLLQPGGWLGLVIPSAFLRAEGAMPLRRKMILEGSFRLIREYWNTERVFDIHPMFRFLVVAWQDGGEGGISKLSLGNRRIDQDRATGITLSRAFLKSVSGNRLSVPDVRTKEQSVLLSRLSSNHPLLGDRDAGTWNVRFVRELDMTGAQKRFLTLSAALRDGAVLNSDGIYMHPNLGTLLPVYEGRMVHQHDSYAKAHIGGTGRSAEWKPLPPSQKYIGPQYLVPSSTRLSGELPQILRAGFCDITGHANERTVLSSILPIGVIAGNKVPTLRFDRDQQDLHFLWVAIANSFVIDWIARRRVSTSMNFFQWEQIPFPRLDPDSRTGSQLISLAKELSSWTEGKDDLVQLEQRARLRARIDALVAFEFGLNLVDMVLILKDFPLLDRGFSSVRSTQTRDIVLLELSRLMGQDQATLHDAGLSQDDGPVDLAERVDDASLMGNIAFVPAEMTRMVRASGRQLVREAG